MRYLDLVPRAAASLACWHAGSSGISVPLASSDAFHVTVDPRHGKAC
jgi:hypothetical protein